MEPKFELTDDQWGLISDLFDDPPPSPLGGRPRVSVRDCFEAIAWILRTRARWRDLPDHFPSHPTCWRRLKQWSESGLFKTAWARLVNKLDRQGEIDRAESMSDGTFSSAKKRGLCVGKTKRGKGTKIMLLIDGNGVPCGNMIESASPHEVKLIEPLLASRVIRRRPRKLIYDAAADSDPLRFWFRKRGIDLIAPHKRNRVKPPTQDRRKFRRYLRRWKVERSISRLQNFRRLVTRYEFYRHLFQRFVNLACLIQVAKRF